MEYKGVEISLHEKEKFLVSQDYSSPTEYTVGRDNGLVFAAKSKYGFSFALTAVDALEGAKKLIDDKVR